MYDVLLKISFYMLETINEEEAKEEGHHNRSSFLKNVGKKPTKITAEDFQKK